MIGELPHKKQSKWLRVSVDIKDSYLEGSLGMPFLPSAAGMFSYSSDLNREWAVRCTLFLHSRITVGTSSRESQEQKGRQ